MTCSVLMKIIRVNTADKEYIQVKVKKTFWALFVTA